jgi:integrase
MARQNLTDRKLKALKPAPAGTRIELWDSVVPGLGVRVTDNGTRTFVLYTRFPGSTSPTRRSLGEYGAITLEAARAKARHWAELIHKGKDPAAEEERKRLAELRKQKDTFGVVAESFIKHISRQQKLRSAPEMEHDLRTVFIKRWGARPITDVTSDDIKKVIRGVVDRGARYRAFALFALIRRLFNWAIGTDDYGLENNPCRRLNTGDLIGERHARDRTLTDDELRALWRVTRRMGYPYGPLYRLLTLTGLRLGEACGATWGEINMPGKVWTIPSTRMKKVKGGAKPHLVPLTDAMVAILKTLPRFSGGDHLFSNDYGRRPLRPNYFSDVKEAVDWRLLRVLRAMARLRGDDPARVVLKEWVNHDIRRTVRTHLSALRVPEAAREAVLAHVRSGIKGTYDKYEYLDEKREALTLWSVRLRSIVEPAGTTSCRCGAPKIPVDKVSCGHIGVSPSETL